MTVRQAESSARKAKIGQEEAQALSRRERVLIEAERLFALEGFHGVSMRDIAQAADVKLALMVYHFETKAKLYHAIFAHRKDLFEERLQGLKNVTDLTAPDALERIVHAFVEPIVRSQMSSAGKSYAQLVAREAADPCSETRGIIAEYFDPFAREFVRAIQLALPRKSPEYVHWAYLFSVGALVMSVFDSRVATISNGSVKPASLAAKTRHMTTFIAAGIRGGPDM